MVAFTVRLSCVASVCAGEFIRSQKVANLGKPLCLRLLLLLLLLTATICHRHPPDSRSTPTTSVLSSSPSSSSSSLRTNGEKSAQPDSGPPPHRYKRFNIVFRFNHLLLQRAPGRILPKFGGVQGDQGCVIRVCARDLCSVVCSE